MKPEKTIEKVIALLHDDDAHKWTLRDKAALLAAIKLLLARKAA